MAQDLRIDFFPFSSPMEDLLEASPFGFGVA